MIRVRGKARITRRPFRTLLIVGEGDAEVEFLRHLGRLYFQRGSGLRLFIKNAYGKGGRHVLERADRARQNIHYDHVAIMIDTDSDWSDRERAAAKRLHIQPLESVPCIEAVLLRIAGEPASGSSQTLKRQFRAAFGSDAHDEKIYPRHFSFDVIETARSKEQLVDAILELLRNP
jgi:hypothetical protein